MSENSERLGWFLVEEEIARTPSGRLVRAKDTDLGVVSAIEVLNPAIVSDAGLVKRFRDEVRLARSAEHAAFSRPLDVVMQDDVTFVVSEWIVGESLATRLARGVVDVVEAMRFVRKACEAIATLHRLNLVHRGLSPDALIVRPDGFLVVVRMCAVTPGEARQRTGRIDKAPFAAPEAQRGDPVTPAADVYSLGAILYALIAGAAPDPTKRPALSSVSPDVPPILDEILGRVLSDDVAARPKDAAALIDELLPLEALLGISDPHATVGATASPPPRIKMSERDLPTRETTRATEPTHVMALPPYSQFSLEAPAGGAILPEMLVDELLMPRGRALRERKAKPPENDPSKTDDPVAATSSTPSTASVVDGSTLPLDGAPPLSDAHEPKSSEQSHGSRVVPRPVTAAHHLPSLDDTLPLEAIDDSAFPRTPSAHLLMSDEATELSLSPPSQMRTGSLVGKSDGEPTADGSYAFPADLDPLSLPPQPSSEARDPVEQTMNDLRPPDADQSVEPSAASDDHTLPFETVDGGAHVSSDAEGPDIRATPLATAFVNATPDDDEPRPQQANASTADSEAAPDETSEPLVDMSEDAEPILGDDATDEPRANDTPVTSAERAVPVDDSVEAAFLMRPAESETAPVSSKDERRPARVSPVASANFTRRDENVSKRPRALVAAAGVVAVVLIVSTVVVLSRGDSPKSDDPPSSTVAVTATPITATVDVAPTKTDVPPKAGDVAATGPDVPPSDVPATGPDVPATVADVPAPDDADDDDDPDTVVPTPGVDPRPVDDDRSANANFAARVKSERLALDRAMGKRGLRSGDDKKLDGMRARANQAMTRGAAKEALAELVAARRRVGEIKVDADFVEAKLKRARVALKKIEKPAVRRKASGFLQKAADALKKKKPTSAHIFVNRALKLVPDA